MIAPPLKTYVATFAAACAVALLAMPNSGRAAPVFDAAVASQIDFVGKLLFDSSAARRVVDAGSEEALVLRARAEEHYAAAVELHANGSDEAAGEELDEAVRLMQDAVRASADEAAESNRANIDVSRRRESVEALLAAHGRISEEKGLEERHAELTQNVEALLQSAEESLAAGRLDAARESTDAAYRRVQQAVEELRQGDTVVRTLDFETPEEEYRYELDRNDTHRMLILVLLDDKLENPQRRTLAQTFIDAASDLRDAAEEKAGAGQYDEAIDLVEDSTKEYIRAIRSAGVYIPG